MNNGTFTTPVGDRANLISGKFQLANGSTGDIYSAVPTMRPDVSTLAIPTPWTSSGLGVAIPASRLESSAGHNVTNLATSGPLTTEPTRAAATTGYLSPSGLTQGNATTLPLYTISGTRSTSSAQTTTKTRSASTPTVKNGENGSLRSSIGGSLVGLMIGLWGLLRLLLG